MKKIIPALALIMATSLTLPAQNTDCKVYKPELVGSYQGGCKNGLAQGKGVARGTDSYEGEFSKGLPDGKGTYRWAEGIYYQGEFRNGLREGKGSMVYPDSVITGYWKKDRYVGRKKPQEYSIVTSLSVSRYSITKSVAKIPAVKIRIMQGGVDNISIEDFSMVYDSGGEYRSGNYYGIENVSFPLSVKIKYRSWNQLMTSQYNVIFEFVIYEPGSWDVMIYN